MKRLALVSGSILIMIIFSNLVISGQAPDTGVDLTEDLPDPERASPSIGQFFTENKGQWEGDFSYVGRTGFGFTYFTDDGVIHQMAGFGSIKIGFEGSRTSPVGMEEMGFPSNYFIGDDPDGWVKGARSYRTIVFENVWNDIDIEYYYSDSGLKYDMIVGEFGKVSDIRLKVDSDHDLHLSSDMNSLMIGKQFSIIDGDLKTFGEDGSLIPSNFRLIDDRTYGFSVDRDTNEEITIDPLVYSTIISGEGYDQPSSITKDDRNCTYLYGHTNSPDFPNTTGAYSNVNYNFDTFLLKLNSNGTDLEFATFLGGWSVDLASKVCIDDDYDIYLGGRTYGLNFPITSGVLQEEHFAADDITLTKLNSTGDELIYSTFIGGDTNDMIGDMLIVDDQVYIAAYSGSHFIAAGAGLSGVHGFCFFAIVNENATDIVDTMVWDGYYGEYPTSMKIDEEGAVIIGGYTFSNDFPTTPYSYQYQVNNLQTGGFLVKYDPILKSAGFSSIIGEVSIQDIELGSDSSIYCAGTVVKRDFDPPPSIELTNGTFSTEYKGNRDFYVAKLTKDCTSLTWSTLVGGSENESSPDLHLDFVENLYVVGETGSDDMPVTSSNYDGTLDGEKDIFFFKMNNNGTTLMNSSYFGFNSTDEYKDSLFEDQRGLIISGLTNSLDFPMTGDLFNQSTHGFGSVFLSKLTVQSPPGCPISPSAEEGDKNITLGWEPPMDNGGLGITGYNLYRSTDRYNLALFKENIEETTYIDTDLEVGVDYYYSISAVNIIGEGHQSEIVSNISSTLPDAPRDLEVKVDPHDITINFNPPASTGGVPLLGYEIFRDNVSIATLTPNRNYHVDSNIGMGVDYTYHATCWNRNGISPVSGAVNTRSKNIPSPPGSLTAILTESSVFLRWEEPDDFGDLPLDKYIVYKGNTTDRMVPIMTLPGDRVTFEDPFRVIDVEYHYAVSALNFLGESNLSELVTARQISKPGSPSDLTAIPGPDTITLNWQPPAKDGGSVLIGYHVYHGMGTEAPSLLATVNETTTSFIHELPGPSVDRVYYVTAFNSMGESDGTDMVFCKTLGNPLPPEDLIATACVEGIRISWKEPSSSLPISGYVIFRSDGEDDPVELSSVEPTLTEFLDPDVERKILYGYMLKAITGMGGSPFSPCVQVEALSYPDPVEEIELIENGSGLRIEWELPPYIGGREITKIKLYRIDPGGSTDLIRTFGPDVREYDDRSPERGKDYSYYLDISNEIGSSGQSRVVTGSLMGLPPTPMLTSLEVVSGSVVIIWDMPDRGRDEQVDSFFIFRTDVKGQKTYLASVDGGSRIFIDTTCVFGEKYDYWIKAKNQVGESAESEKRSIVVLESVDEENENEGIDAIYLSIVLGSLILLVVLMIIFLIARSGTGLEEFEEWGEE